MPHVAGERLIVLVIPGCFGTETGGGGAVFDAELWISPLEMFSDSRWRNSEDHADLGIRFSAIIAVAS
jgi:hypothetical protein